MDNLDKLDQLHVVSDLHLGGTSGHQIFNQGAALAALIDHLRSLAPRAVAMPAGHPPRDSVATFQAGDAERRAVGLVLNGDIVDFLAAPDAEYLDHANALKKLEAIFDEEAFRPVWDALARFTCTPGCLLVLVLGNHDVELALPTVTARLLERLCGADRQARDRVRLALGKEGYRCLVGGREVLCIHGNLVDPWNPIDFSALDRFIAALEAGKSPPDWVPNAGTRLVIDVMNGIKRDFAFVDLLKPETVPVAAVLLALPPQYQSSLLDFARVMARKLYDQGRIASGFLGGRPAAELEGERALELLMRPDVWDEGAWEAPQTGRDWLAQATADFEDERRPVDFARGDDALGFAGLIWDRLRQRDPRENLRQALAKYLTGDRTFRLDTEDSTFHRIDALAGDADFVVVGHTHLARCLARKKGRGVYYNSGTWIRLIQLTPPMLTPEGFAPVYDALRAGTLEALDRVPDLVLQRRNVVSIWADGAQVHGELRSAAEVSPGVGPPAQPWIADRSTRFSIDKPAAGARGGSETPS